MKWKIFQVILVLLIFGVSWFIGDSFYQMKQNELMRCKVNLIKHQTLSEDLRTENDNLKTRILQDINQNFKAEHKTIVKKVIDKSNMYEAILKKNKLFKVKYIFKLGSDGATLYCVDNRNNQVCYIDISSGEVVYTPKRYWGLCKRIKICSRMEK